MSEDEGQIKGDINTNSKADFQERGASMEGTKTNPGSSTQLTLIRYRRYHVILTVPFMQQAMLNLTEFGTGKTVTMAIDESDLLLHILNGYDVIHKRLIAPHPLDKSLRIFS